MLLRGPNSCPERMHSSHKPPPPPNPQLSLNFTQWIYCVKYKDEIFGSVVASKYFLCVSE